MVRAYARLRACAWPCMRECPELQEHGGTRVAAASRPCESNARHASLRRGGVLIAELSKHETAFRTSAICMKSDTHSVATGLIHRREDARRAGVGPPRARDDIQINRAVSVAKRCRSVIVVMALRASYFFMGQHALNRLLGSAVRFRACEILVLSDLPCKLWRASVVCMNN